MPIHYNTYATHADNVVILFRDILNKYFMQVIWESFLTQMSYDT